MNDKNKEKVNSSLRERFKDYIYYASNTIKDYDNLRKKFLDLSTFMITFIIVIFTITVNINISLNNSNLILIDFILSRIIPTLLIFAPSLLVFTCNIYFFIMENPTILNKEKNWKTLWFYRGLIERKKEFTLKELKEFYQKFHSEFENNEHKFIEDDKKQLFILYCYQSNRYNSAVIMRKIFFVGIVTFIITVPIFLITSFCLVVELIALIISIVVLILVGKFCIFKEIKK